MVIYEDSSFMRCYKNVFFPHPCGCRLYNKDAVIEYLLDKSAERPNSEVVAHIRGIKVGYIFCFA